MLAIIPLENVVYSFFYFFNDVDLADKLACRRLVDMFINKVVLYDKYCEIYFNTNVDKSKRLKLKEQPDAKVKFCLKTKRTPPVFLRA